jgi:N,N'-diacetylchitobiose transport system permease protein
MTAVRVPAATARRRPRKPSRVVYSVIAVIVFLVSVFPVYWMVNTSFLPNNLTRTPVPHFWPDAFTLRNYQTIFEGGTRTPFLPALANSLTVTLLVIVVALIFGFLAALAVTRFRFRGRYGFIIAVLVVQMVPGEAMIVSLYRLLEGWHLLNNVIGLVIVYSATALPFTIWTLRGFVNGVPVELEEAAMIDGCSRLGAFWRVTFPLLAPGLVATGVFAFITAWIEFVFALVSMSDAASYTLPVWLRTYLQANTTTNWAGVMAGSTLIAIPVVVFFMIVQGRMAGGLTAGAVKG